MTDETPDAVALEYLAATEGVTNTAMVAMARQILALEADLELCRGMVGRGYVKAKPNVSAALRAVPPAILLAADDP